ncbi:sensor domain-containing diguanylate cyclase [Actimicrobium antarcticum]|uniref:diguanylate cyclase n=1 Tax=Actimicrobium antarcticum TaxID=1051899 RepID=A0ABP7T911_9BURK
MPNKLVTENMQLRDRLVQLLEQAKRNQQIMRRHQEFDLKFIAANGLRELVDSIFDTLSESSQLDVVTLCLSDADYDIRRIMADLAIDQSEFPNLLFSDREADLGLSLVALKSPFLGKFNSAKYGALFPEQVLTPVSMAIVPLMRQGRLIGFLSLGSLHDSRFSNGMATDFIEHLGSIIAICLENVINNERLKRIGLTDSLTGVNNRRYLELRLREEIGRTRRQEFSLSCLYIDIDHFKKINDSVGHQGGDEVLQQVAARIKAELRLSDALGRFGGEEFVVLLIDAPLTHALAVAERIRASIADQPVVLSNEEELRATVSIGAAELNATEPARSIEKIASELIARADAALYQAKEGGRNQVIGNVAAKAG